MKFYEFKEDEKRVDIFNERWYRHPDTGKFYRNVTTILGIIHKGYNFDQWLKNNGHNADIILDRAGTFGTTFHQMVEKFLLGGTVTYFDYNYLGERTATALWERFSTWHAWWEELNREHDIKYKPEGVEHIVYSEKHEYAGTVDFICKVDDVPTIFDWKTGSTVGNSAKQQQIAYMEPLGIEVANLIHIPHNYINKKGYRVTEVKFDKDKFDLFLATKKVFDSEHKDKPKVLTLPLIYEKEKE